MKNIVKTIFISFCASIGGAYAYATWFSSPIDVFYKASNIDNSIYQQTANHTGSIGAASLSIDFVAASAASTPCVVYIKTVSGQQTTSWLDLWMNGGMGSGKQLGSGSGVIFTADGYVVTNNHVIDNAETIEVIHQKKSYIAKVVGTDPSADLAVLKIQDAPQTFPFIKVADSRKVAVGEWVLAVGNPFNLNSTVTAGIVSAKGRNLNIVNSTFPIESFIQTDAAINPGNSGGALVNLKGELIGINSAIYSQTGSYAGYGFAVPSDIVQKIVNDLIKYGETQKAFLGLDVADLNTKVAKELNTEDLNGVVVVSLNPTDVAAEAGMRKGDIIIKLDGADINTKGDFDEVMSYHNPGDKIILLYRRNDKVNLANITLTNREGTTAKLKRELYISNTLGAQLETVSKVERDRLNITNGVKIVKYIGNGLLRGTGFEEGTVINQINDTKVNSPSELENTISNVRGRLIIAVTNRQGQRFSTAFTKNQ